MSQQPARNLLLLTDDNFLAEVLGTYTRRDDIEVERSASIADAIRAIDDGVGGVVVDISKRGMAGDAVMDLARLAAPRHIPMLILSSRPRHELMEFAAIVQAADVVSKTEPMTAIAERVLSYVRPHQRPRPTSGNLKSLGWAPA